MDAGIEQHLAAGRHARAFDLVVPAYKDRVFRLAYSMLKDRAAAEDAPHPHMLPEPPLNFQNLRQTAAVIAF